MIELRIAGLNGTVNPRPRVAELRPPSAAALFRTPLAVLRAGVASLLALPGQAPAGAPAARPPNIIVVLTDDQGYGDLSRHGNPALQTPHLDRVFEEGVRFSNFVVSATCSPTRAALLTGRHEFKSGVTHTLPGRCELSLDATTLANVLKSAGYATGIFGKWHLGDEGEHRPEKRGFDFVVRPKYDRGDARFSQSYFDPLMLIHGVEQPRKGFREDILFDEAVQFIMAHRDRPFFCYLPTYSPHQPCRAPPEYLERCNGNAFLAMVANIDDNVGRLMKTLAATGLDASTLVILMNDNGGTEGVDIHNAGMRGCKATAWFGGTRAFCAWRWLGRFPPRTLNQLAGHVDVFPTLAELAGARLPSDLRARLDGVSLLPLLNGGPDRLPDRMLISHVGRWPNGEAAAHKYAFCSVHWNGYQLVRSETCGQPACQGECRVFRKVTEGATQTIYTKNAGFHYAVNPRQTWSLYDTGQDPAQEHDLAAARPELVRRMAAAYERWWAEVLPSVQASGSRR